MQRIPALVTTLTLAASLQARAAQPTFPLSRLKNDSVTNQWTLYVADKLLPVGQIKVWSKDGRTLKATLSSVTDSFTLDKYTDYQLEFCPSPKLGLSILAMTLGVRNQRGSSPALKLNVKQLFSEGKDGRPGMTSPILSYDPPSAGVAVDPDNYQGGLGKTFIELP